MPSGVWMPYIAFTNVKALSQDRVVRFGLGYDPEGEGHGWGLRGLGLCSGFRVNGFALLLEKQHVAVFQCSSVLGII